tara:strand:+ start:1225 stop:2196 length:972 start_codon:yes stop_codon:yes gene_type:complete
LKNLPVFVSLGDPAGIGPEVFVKSLKDDLIYSKLDSIIVVCSQTVITNMLSLLKNKIPINIVKEDGKTLKSHINLINVEGCGDYSLGSPSNENAKFVIDCLKIASDAANEKSCYLVTGPINKSVIQDHIMNFMGHTEFLKERFSCSEVLMMLTNSKLNIGVSTTHVALKEVPSLIKKELVKSKFKLLSHGIENIYGKQNPKIGVLGLNPHAGESGSFGSEEQNEIIPAINELNSDGYCAIGPIPADTAFSHEKYDGILSMYHDQALPVLKTLDFENTVNVTLGLPFMRISVDHGTAEDIADKLIANQKSMTQALKISIALNET